ncbi:MAG: DUF4166 domain-containing protein [Pseudomonadota bacterium]
MITQASAQRHIEGQRPAPSPPAEPLGDLRFPALVPAHDWAALPAPVRRRFTKRLVAGESQLYGGQVTETRLTWAGWLIAQAARLIGAPLPLAAGGRAAASVAVTEDPALQGQIWTRIYQRPGRFAQVIHSVKRFAGPTGLEEYVGRGVGMALTLHVAAGALLFRSAGFYLQLGRRRVALPRALMPLDLAVTHREESGGHFSFTLQLTHRRFGELIYQRALFREMAP